MTHLNSNHTDRTSNRPRTGIDPDAFLIDEEFDDSLDLQVFALRESLNDFRNV